MQEMLIVHQCPQLIKFNSIDNPVAVTIMKVEVDIPASYGLASQVGPGEKVSYSRP